MTLPTAHPPDDVPTPRPEDTRAAIARSTSRIEDVVEDLRVGQATTQATQREHTATLARIEAAQVAPGAWARLLAEPLWPPRTGTAIVVVVLLVGAVWAVGAGTVERLLGLLPLVEAP